MASSGGGSSGGQGGGYNKVGALLLAGGLAILIGAGTIIVDIPRDSATPAATAAPAAASPIAAATSAPASPPPPPPPMFDREALRGRDRNAVVLTITAYGMPARIGVQAANDSEVRSRGAFDAGLGVDYACNPDTQYPNPCVTYIVTQRGANVTVTAGDARAGLWPLLESLEGGGCKLTDGATDKSCTVTLAADIEMTARYYGEDSSGKHPFPKCPPNTAEYRARFPSSAWLARCQ